MNMIPYSVKNLLSEAPLLQEVVVNGWVKTFRSNRFIALNDGSTIENIQCVVAFEQFDEALLRQIVPPLPTAKPELELKKEQAKNVADVPVVKGDQLCPPLPERRRAGRRLG